MKIMGILNVTPDSFSDGGKFFDIESAVKQALIMVEDGADIIDIGGESTRPGAKQVTLDEELARVLPVIKGIREVSDVLLSIDTYKSEVARAAVAAGANIINDVWAGRADESMLKVMSELNVPVILMHNRFENEETSCVDSIMHEVIFELGQRIHEAEKAGISRKNIIIDPGIGFGKTLEQNIALMKNVGDLKKLGFPVMLAASKKRSIRHMATGLSDVHAQVGTIATTIHAFNQGVDIVRVHDVLENSISIKTMKNLI